MSTPIETIEKYIEETRLGNVEGLKNLFSPEALMSGFYESEYYSGSPEAFFEEVRDSPSPSESGQDYNGEITHTEVIGKIAQVTMKEKGYLGLNFSNLFHLACINDKWLIISKTYMDE
jgi:hypothetical protein